VNTLQKFFLTFSLSLSFLFLAQSETFAAAPSNGAWTPVGSMATRRILSASTLLQNGKVLVAGGQPSGGGTATFEPLINFTELYDPNTRTWSTTGNLNTPRMIFNSPYHIMVTLQNGKALIAGGMDANFNSIGSAELYDPTTGTWSYTGSLNTSRRDMSMVLLTDGRVLASAGTTGPISGTILSTSELYDPTTGTWSYTTNNLATPRDGATTIKLQDSRVLIVGGNQADGSCINTAEIFDPTTNTWSSAGTMPFAGTNIAMTLLSDGRVFVTRGSCGAFTADAAIYDPAANTWTATANLPVFPVMNSFLLANGKVLVRSGDPNAGNTSVGTVAPVDEVYDPTTNTWTTTNLPLGGNNGGTYTQLANGDVLKAGGWDCDASNPSCTLASAELFTTANNPPVVNTISVSTNPVQVNTPTTASANFTDADTADIHTASWNWGDGNTTTGTVTESNGSGSVSDSHTYSTAGVYTVTLTVTDNHGASGTSTFQYVSVYNPTSQGLFSAGQHFTSPAGAYPQNTSLTGTVKFGLSYKYQGTMPVGDKQFTMNFTAANLTFNATTVSSLVIANGIGTLTGTGTLNGSGTYSFLVTGNESANTIRIQIKVEPR
jgi:N-acetylneuraminic acid mutarotase